MTEVTKLFLESIAEFSKSSTRTYWRLFKSFLYDRQVASIAPSSRFVAKTVVDIAKGINPTSIIELGPGDGALTYSLLDLLPSDGHFLGIESNEELATELNEEIFTKRQKIIHNSALYLRKICAPLSWQPDMIVSGIPVSILNSKDSLSFIEQAHSILSPNGLFIAYQTWLPPFITPKKMELHIRSVFKNCSSTLVYRNIPPLKVLYATRN